jgi:cell division protein FtsW
LERIDKRAGDFLLLLTLILLTGVGLSMLFSASHYYALRVFDDSFYFFKRQIIWILLGCLVALIASKTPLEFFKETTPYLLLLALVLSLLTFVPGIGRSILGARRWIFFFGQSFEPSELVKFAVVLYLAAIFSKKRERINDPVNSILPPLLIVTVFVTLIYFQNDFSTAFFILFIALTMFYIAQVKLRYFVMLSALVIPLGSLLLFTKAHRVQRLIAFLNPLADPTGSGYQIIAARQSIISGGFWGRGLGRGLKKLGGLPEAHSDFIFAVIGEEAGFLGALFVLTLFVVFAWRGYAIAVKSRDSFNYYLAFGITTVIVMQVLLNIAVVTGLVPATGIPLPFFSSGGSSMLLTLFLAGLLMNLSRSVEPVERKRRV